MKEIQKYITQGTVAPVTALALLAFAYQRRGQELKASGKIADDSIMSAIQYDVKNFSGTAALDRLKGKIAEVAILFIMYNVAKRIKVFGKWGGVISGLLQGAMIYTVVKALLDPPIANEIAAYTLRTPITAMTGTVPDQYK